jgi:D-alanine--D-alanine ligase
VKPADQFLREFLVPLHHRPHTSLHKNQYVPETLGRIRPAICVPKFREHTDSYEAKYVDDDGAELKIPAEIDPQVSLKIRKAAVESFLITECRGMARVDFFLRDDNTFILNEINTLPGFTKSSMFPKLWDASGLPYAELLDRLIELAQE